MKMFDVSKMQPAQLTDGKPNEILGLSRLKHDNIIKFYNSGTYTAEGCNYEYMVMEFVSGALLSEYVNNGKLLNFKEAAYYFTQILSGLDYMQSTFKVNHYDITPRNIILSKTSDGKTLPKIIDFGHIDGTVMGKPDFCVTDLNLLYSAPETLTGMFNSKSDAFSATATFYFMLTGKAPWNVKYDDTNNYQIQKKLVRDARKQPLDLTNIPAELLSEEGDCLSKIIIFVDDGLPLDDWNLVVWYAAGNVDPAVDCFVIDNGRGGCLCMDATAKTRADDDFRRDWPEVVMSDDATISSVDNKKIGDLTQSPSIKLRKLRYNNGAVKFFNSSN